VTTKAITTADMAYSFNDAAAAERHETPVEKRGPLYTVVGLTEPARAPAIDNAGALAEYASVPSHTR
jgi:hypothetical protein